MTHTVEVTDEVLTKHYTSWSRDEPGREWAALTLLSQHAPGLAPIPLDRSQLDGAPPGPRRPWVSMSVLPGQPLSGAVTPTQLDAFGDALTTLWSIDPQDLPPLDTPALVDRTRTALALLRTGVGVIADAATAAAFWLTLIGPGGPSAGRNPPGTAEAQARRVLGLLRPAPGAP